MTLTTTIFPDDDDQPLHARLAELLKTLIQTWTFHFDLRRLTSDNDVRLWRPLLQMDYELYWTHDHDWPVERHLSFHDELLGTLGLRNDSDLILELIETEIQHAGVTPHIEDYRDRFPRIPADQIQSLIDAHQYWGNSLSYASRDGIRTNESIKVDKAVEHDTLSGRVVAVDDTYQIGRQLGMGGNKVVYVAVQESTGQTVALKVPVHRINIDGVDRIVVEARITAQMQHQNIPAVYTVSSAGGEPILAEKLIVGESWLDAIRADRQTLKDCSDTDRPRRFLKYLDRHLTILLQVCNALSYTHRDLKVIHRDIKPKNVMLGRFGEVYLVDWELAVQVGERPDPQLSAPHLQQTENALGTPDYMAPEMATVSTRLLSTATDVFLLGAVLYEILTGAAPYRGDSGTVRKTNVLLARFTPAEQRGENLSLPRELLDILDKAMQLAPQDRYPDAMAFAEAIRSYQRHASGEQIGTEAQQRYRQLLVQHPEAADHSQTSVGSRIATHWKAAVCRTQNSASRRLEDRFIEACSAYATFLLQAFQVLGPSFVAMTIRAFRSIGSFASATGRRSADAFHAWRNCRAIHTSKAFFRREFSAFNAAITTFFTADSSDSSLRRYSPWIEVAGLFRQAARAWEPESDKRLPQPWPAAYEQQVRGEAEVRWSLVRLARRSGDYSLCADQLNLLKAMLPDSTSEVETEQRQIRYHSSMRRFAVFLSVGAVLLASVTGFNLMLSQRKLRSEIELRERAELATEVSDLLAELAPIQAQAILMRQRTAFQTALLYQSQLLRKIQERPDSIRPLLQSQIDEVDQTINETLQTTVVPLRFSSVRMDASALCWSRDESLLAVGSNQEGEVQIWSRSGQLLRMVGGYTGIGSTPGYVARILADPESGTESGTMPTRQRFLVIGNEGRIFAVECSFRDQSPRIDVVSAPVPSTVKLLDGGTPGSATARWIATLAADSTVTLRDRSTLKVLSSFPTGIADLKRLCVHPRGEWIAVGGESGEIALLSPQGKTLRTIPPPAECTEEQRVINALTVSPDGRKIACGRRDGIIRIWNAANGKPVQQLTGHTPDVSGVNWVSHMQWASESFLASSGRDGWIRTWNPVTGQPAEFRSDSESTLTGDLSGGPVAVSASGALIASSSADARLRIWKTNESTPLLSTEGMLMTRTMGCQCEAILPGRNVLLAAGAATDATIRAFDASTLRELRTYLPSRSMDDVQKDGYESIVPITISAPASERIFAVATLSGDLAVYDVDSRAPLCVVRDAHGPKTEFPATLSPALSVPSVLSIAWSPTGQQLVSLGSDRRIILWNWDNVTHQLTLVSSWRDSDPQRDAPLQARVAQIDQLLPTAADPEKQQLQLEREGHLVTLSLPRSSAILFDPDGQHVVTLGDQIRRWNAASGTMVEELTGHHSPVLCGAFQESRLVTGSGNGRVILWNWKNPGRTPDWSIDLSRVEQEHEPVSLQERFLPAKSVVTSLQFSPGFGMIAATKVDGSVSLIDVETGALMQSVMAVEQHSPAERNPLFATFNAQGSLVTTTTRGQITLWDLRPAESGIVRSQTRGIRQVAANPVLPQWAWLRHQEVVVTAASHDAQPLSQVLTTLSWQTLTEDEGNHFNPSAIQFSPDGKRLVVGASDGRCAVFDTSNWTRLGMFTPTRPHRPELLNFRNAVTTIAIDARNQTVATNSQTSAVDFWSLETGQLFRTLNPDSPANQDSLPVADLEFHPSAQLIAVTDQDGRLSIVSSETLETVSGHPVGTQTVVSDESTTGPSLSMPGDHQLAWSRDGQFVLQLGFAGDLVIWDSASGSKVRTVQTHSPRPMLLGFGKPAWFATGHTIRPVPGSDSFLTSGSDGTIRCWTLNESGDLKLDEIFATCTLSSHRRQLQTVFPKEVPPEILNSDLPPEMMAELQQITAEIASMDQTTDGVSDPSVVHGELEVFDVTADGRFVLAGGLATPLTWLNLDAMRSELKVRREELFLNPEQATGLRLENNRPNGAAMSHMMAERPLLLP